MGVDKNKIDKNNKQSNILSGEHRTEIYLSAKEQHGIETLKVGYNKVFGYYIEVSKANAASRKGLGLPTPPATRTCT